MRQNINKLIMKRIVLEWLGLDKADKDIKSVYNSIMYNRSLIKKNKELKNEINSMRISISEMDDQITHLLVKVSNLSDTVDKNTLNKSEINEKISQSVVDYRPEIRDLVWKLINHKMENFSKEELIKESLMQLVDDKFAIYDASLIQDLKNQIKNQK